MSDAVSGFGFCDTIVAGADISGDQYKVIGITGTIAPTNDLAYGILENKPQSGEAGTVKVFGKSMALAGAAVAANAKLAVQSGYLIAVSSGDLVVPCGKNIGGAVNSGDIMTVAVNFINTGADV